MFAHGLKAPLYDGDSENINVAFQDSLKWADYYFNIYRYDKAIDIYKKSLEAVPEAQSRILKKLALSEAAMKNSEASVGHLNAYLKTEFNPSFLSHEGFDPIRSTSDFQYLESKVVPKITAWSIFYLFVALVGFYVIFIIGTNRKIDKNARRLITGFIFIHSLFILNICIQRSNYSFEFPHTYLISTWSSLLYGPLLYFYFKRITEKYTLKWKDLIHLLPTIALTAYLLPTIYLLSAEQKTSLMLNQLLQGQGPLDSNKLLIIVLLKTLSLATYAIYINKVYRKMKGNKIMPNKNLIWQRNIYHIHVLYVITYCIYGALITNSVVTGIFFHIPVIMMAAMVLYVGYIANLQPDVFSGICKYTNRLFPKYVKSGLTDGLSQELKDSLLQLFTEDKLYRRNDLTLEIVASKLNTTRHNASQVINEHFNANFHELINSYRIKEAKEMLLNKGKQNLNIIDIAYEVGFNNKVTFNKAFKKDTDQTPTQFLKTTHEMVLGNKTSEMGNGL